MKFSVSPPHKSRARNSHRHNLAWTSCDACRLLRLRVHRLLMPEEQADQFLALHGDAFEGGCVANEGVACKLHHRLVIVAPVLLQLIGMGPATELLIKFGRWPALAVLLLLSLAILYRYGPSRRSPKWRWISVGSVTATVAWTLGSALLSFYLSNFGHYDATYGSLGAAIALMVLDVDVDDRGSVWGRAEFRD